MSEPTRSWSNEEIQGDGVSKKDIASFLQENGSIKFQVDNKLKMSIKNVTKNNTKDQLMAYYNELFETKAFKKEGEEAEYEAQKLQKVTEQAEQLDVKEKDVKKSAAAAEPPKYTKKITNKGTSKNKPVKGDTVAVHYTGKLEDGTVFDSTLPQGKKLNERSKHKSQPLKFKVGLGKVIRGWDECLLTMCIGESAEVHIEAAWAYGKKAVDGPLGKIPPKSNLIFDMELVNIE